MTNTRRALCLLPLCAVATPVPAAGSVNLDNLCQHWVRSGEEETRASKDQIYRPAGHAGLPPSRFRMAYKFKRNGDCDWLSLSPDDDHHFKPGRWRLNHDGQLQITANGVTETYRIVECSRQLLRLTPIFSASKQ